MISQRADVDTFSLACSLFGCFNASSYGQCTVTVSQLTKCHQYHLWRRRRRIAADDDDNNNNKQRTGCEAQLATDTNDIVSLEVT